MVDVRQALRVCLWPRMRNVETGVGPASTRNAGTGAQPAPGPTARPRHSDVAEPPGMPGPSERTGPYAPGHAVVVPGPRAGEATQRSLRPWPGHSSAATAASPTRSSQAGTPVEAAQQGILAHRSSAIRPAWASPPDI